MRTRACLVVVVLLAGCQGDKGPPATGPVTPTVAAGVAGPVYADGAQARLAFTRRSATEVLTATLEDAAWLRYEGDPQTVQEAHRAYFEHGYTTFQVMLRAKEFTRPTDESYLLEDSTGARLTGRAHTFQGNLTPVDDRWQYTFSLSFQHSLSAEVRWIKLTRTKDGSFVEWRFDGSGAAPR